MQKTITIEEIAIKLRPLFGKKIDEIYFKYMNAEDNEEKGEIFQILTALYQKHLNKLLDKDFLLEPPKKEFLEGEYPVAEVTYAGNSFFKFNLREKDWPRHICITGMSGSGKTTFALNLLESLIKKNKSFLIFDWKKSFRPLMKIDNSIMCFTVGNNYVSNLFKMNINKPPKGVSPKEWINVLCDLLTESFNVSFGVHKILLETLDEIFRGWEIYNGGKNYPNWEHIKKMLEIKSKNAKGREAGWYESALRIATVLTFGDFGKTINYDGKKSFSVEDLFDKKVILELNSLSSIEKKFFCEYILTYVYKLKKAKEEKIQGEFKNVILVDEAHNIFLKKPSQNFVTESVTDMIYREMRGYGVSLICLDQHASKLSDTVLGNSACHVAFQQQLPQDVKEISSLMQLSDRKEIFTNLDVGSAIVKLSERHKSPFLIKSLQTNLRNVLIKDSEIKSKMDCVIQEIEIEKDDPEFKSKLLRNEKEKRIEPSSENKKRETKKEKNFEETIEKKEEIFIHNLTKIQKDLYEIARKKYEEKKNLFLIEKLLNKGIIFGNYNKKDVLLVINKILEEEFKSSNEKNVLEKKNNTKINFLEKNLSGEEKLFVNFLLENPWHNFSTVKIYNILKFSSRKGNTIKNQLLEKGIIKIKEEKNKKGWKKLIKLSDSYSL